MADEIPPRHILIAVDTSMHSKAAFNFYLKLLRSPTDKITLLHVFESPSLPSFSFTKPQKIPTDEWQEILQKKINEVSKMESDYTLDCQTRKLSYTFLSEHHQHVGEAICDKAASLNVDIIVLGNRGLGAIKRTIMGSVSDFVLHHSKIPVAIVPAQETP